MFKSDAFDAMVKQCDGFVAITFPDRYGIECFCPSQPEMRNYVCGPAFSRQYVPLTSHPGAPYPVPGTTKDDICVAMMVPAKHLKHIKHHNEKIDIGRTFLEVIESFEKDKIAVALGVYDCSLEQEMVLAADEEEELKLEPSP